jgi:hypothetical protein
MNSNPPLLILFVAHRKVLFMQGMDGHATLKYFVAHRKVLFKQGMTLLIILLHFAEALAMQRGTPIKIPSHSQAFLSTIPVISFPPWVCVSVVAFARIVLYKGADAANWFAVSYVTHHGYCWGWTPHCILPL